MHPTKNTLSQKIRVESVDLLQDRLSNGIDLNLRVKHAHWNVKGDSFIALHKLFDEIHDSSEEWVDLMAERILQLGGTAIGTVRASATRTKMPDYPMNASGGSLHIEAVAETLARFGEMIRIASDETDRMGDRTTSDIFTEISRSIDKYLWMVEAHQQLGQSQRATNVA